MSLDETRDGELPSEIDRPRARTNERSNVSFISDGKDSFPGGSEGARFRPNRIERHETPVQEDQIGRCRRGLRASPEEHRGHGGGEQQND
jgi:hypothetical protein